VENLLVVIAGGVCRLHKTFRAVPKNEKPLRFAELLKSRILNARIEAAEQLGDNRIVRFVLKQREEKFFLYVRLWSNAANVILTKEDGYIIDVMRRLPKRGETSGGVYNPECPSNNSVNIAVKDYSVRSIEGEGSFNEKIDAWYAEHGQTLSLESLYALAQKTFSASIERISSSIERLKIKEKEYIDADTLKKSGELILSNVQNIKKGDEWLECTDFSESNVEIRIKIDPKKSASGNAEHYFEAYRKAKSGLSQVKDEIESAEAELKKQKERLAQILSETNPLCLQKMLAVKTCSGNKKKRPGLSFRMGEWLIFVGRDSAENDELLRRHAKGNDLWLHVRDYSGSYVFVKARSGKTVPLNILLDAGNLALFYSKGRGNGKGDLLYTNVKYLRRAKNAPRGLVIPTQEKNLSIVLDKKRLKELEACKE
jgi:predicted ribosome quality control (RQC) complex YloA/Tae2 family protein